jgi:mycothiol synthase
LPETAHLPHRYTARPPAAGEATAVRDLVAAYEQVALGEVESDEDDVRTTWARLRFCLETDAWLVIAPDGSPAAYGDVWPRDGMQLIVSDGYVHPAHAGKGIGRWLVRRMEARAREMLREAGAEGPVPLRNNVVGADSAASALLEEEGYRLEQTFWQMETSLGPEPPQPRFPEGVSVRTYRPGDERAIHELVQTSFADNFRHVDSPFEEWKGVMMDSEAFEPETWFVAERDGRIVAVNLCRNYGDTGWIRQVAVARGERRQGLGLALIHHTFRELRKRGKKRCGLSVDSYNRSGARELYERAGMTVLREHHGYEKELRPA